MNSSSHFFLVYLKIAKLPNIRSLKILRLSNLKTLIFSIILQVDLAFAPEGRLGDGFEKVGSGIKCGESFAFMHRKDVVMRWLDMALEDMKKDGSFKSLCDQSWQGN